MAVRIRTNGRIFCAALRPEEPGDIYVDDAVHYHLSCVARVMVSEDIEKHLVNPEWWWRHDIPAHVQMAEHYRNDLPRKKGYLTMLTTQPKSALKSKTIWGGIGAILVGVANVIAYVAAPENAAEVSQLVTGVTATLAGGLATYGRFKAIVKVSVSGT